ncbi:RelA/SpoT domain-containing protein [Micromonospora sp. NPDC049891]|uniref:RelA/SpoT domain-containing protein n=1 Tax=Micromonospora sp. NPDC049891 TaxID=3155655 RepID=UPI00341129A1
MALDPSTLPTKSQINKCGKLLKKAEFEGVSASQEEIENALRVVRHFRAVHAYPMVKVRLGLRSMIRTEMADEAITQRLKRVPRIIRKLHRMPNMPLASLEDIGGVRAVLADGPELDRVRDRVMRRWKPTLLREPRDYISQPKDIGYRAIHFVVERDGRAIEVQLRTRGQQQWADAAEAADARLGLTLKDGVGPADMVEYFSAAGELIFLREYGRGVPPELLQRFEEARQAVLRAGYYSK